MPTTAESPYQAEMRRRRETARQNSASHALVQTQQRDVDETISLDRKATKIEGQLRAFADDGDGFRRQVQLDRVHLRLRIIFWGSVLLYVLAEYLTSGDVSEWLANQLAPVFQVETVSGETPIWLRQAAGGVFVGTMLGVTLLLKFVTTWFGARYKEEQATVQIGEHARHRWLTAGIYSLHFLKVIYMASVAMLYVWLFGFAQERAAITAAIASEQQQSLEWSELGLKIEGGTIETDEAVPKKPDTTTAPVGSKLAWGTGVLYVMLWALHGLVLLLPVDGFGRPLEFTHFKQGAMEKRAESLRETEERLLRNMYERIQSVDGADRDALVRVSLPVARRMNEALGRVVIEVPTAAGTTAAATEPSDAGIGNQFPWDNPPASDGPNGNASTAESDFAGAGVGRDSTPGNWMHEIFGTNQEDNTRH
jgi:hypothetical protein